MLFNIHGFFIRDFKGTGYSSKKKPRVEQTLESLVELQTSYFSYMREKDKENINSANEQRNEDRQLRIKEIENQARAQQLAHEERQKENEIRAEQVALEKMRFEQSKKKMNT
jgi:hypothetical protein